MLLDCFFDFLPVLAVKNQIAKASEKGSEIKSSKDPWVDGSDAFVNDSISINVSKRRNRSEASNSSKPHKLADVESINSRS